MKTTTDYTTTLCAEAVESAWAQFTQEAESFFLPDCITAGRTPVARMREQFLQAIADVDDAEEQENIAALFYAQVRCEWAILNAQSGYRIAAGKTDRDLYARCGMLSSLLERLETCLTDADVTDLCRLTATPLRRMRPAVTGSENTVADAPLSVETIVLRTALREMCSERDTLIADKVLHAAEREQFAAERADWQDAREQWENERATFLEQNAQRDANTCVPLPSSLQDRFGVADTDALVAYVQKLEKQIDDLREYQSLLGSLDETFALANV